MNGDLLFALREVARGKGVGRALTYARLRHWHTDAHGTVVDVACGFNPGYRRVLGIPGDASVRVIGLDLDGRYRPDVVVDATQPLPFADGSADTVICANFLYIHPEPLVLIGELRRLLRPGGVLLVSAPLVYPYSPEPHDYHRFTEAALERLLRLGGFCRWDIRPVGDRWTAALYLLSPYLRPARLVGPPAMLLGSSIDQLFGGRLRPAPIGYVARAFVS